jgi:hypothetical protein
MHECVVDSTSAGLSRKVTAMLELPGMKREAVRLELRNGQLVIEGDRRPPAHAHRSSRRSSARRSPDNLTGPGVPPPNDSRMEESCRAAVAEMRYGRFRRVLTVPPGVDVSHPHASPCAAADSFRRPHRSKPVWKTAFLQFPGRSRATVLVSNTLFTTDSCLLFASPLCFSLLCSIIWTVYSRFSEHCMTIILILFSLFLVINHILVKAPRELLEVWDASVSGIKAVSSHLCGASFILFLTPPCLVF